MTVYRANPYRFTERPAELREFLEAAGLRPVVSRHGFASMRAAGGLVGVHPLADAVSTERVSTGFGLETDDARAAAEDLSAAGLDARWWDVAWGRQAAVTGPFGEITINEPAHDLHGFDVHLSEEPAPVDVVAVFFTPEVDAWARFFARLGFDGGDDPDWRELRAGPDAGVIGLHRSDGPPVASETAALGLEVAEPLAAFSQRMRDLGYRVEEEPGAEALTVTDPDGIAVEVHARAG